MICEKFLSLTYEISRVSKKMLNNECLKHWFWSKNENFSGNFALFPFKVPQAINWSGVEL